jgi:hypothetical protein
MNQQKFTRAVNVAGKDHRCFAKCGEVIPKGEFYIKDTLLDVPAEYGRYPRVLMTVAWHLKCAPVTKDHATLILKDALVQGAKHPTRTGVDYPNT